MNRVMYYSGLIFLLLGLYLAMTDGGMFRHIVGGAMVGLGYGWAYYCGTSA